MRKSVIITILLLISCIQIEQIKSVNEPKETQEEAPIQSEIKGNETKEEKVASLIIPKIDLYQNLYAKESKRNNIEENVTILKESTNNHLILAAHSGTSIVSFFDRLDELEKNDTIIISYQGLEYVFYVTKISEVEKNGKLFLYQNPNETTITLTTCSPNNDNKQLIITGIEKK